MEDSIPSLFLDTSVWIAAILSDRGASYVLIERARYKELTLISSPDVFEEGIRNLQLKYPASARLFFKVFQEIHPLLVQPLRKTVLRAAKIVHRDDAPILAAAIDGKTEILVTLDKKHFLSKATVIARKTGIQAITPGTFLQKYLMEKI